MIPVTGFEGRSVAILGLGRSGLAAAKSLQAGGAIPVCWDDSVEARGRAEAEGFDIRDLTRVGAFDDIAWLVVSPGIPHLYPEPNKVVAAAWEAGVPVDNDIGLFFRSLGSGDWDYYDTPPRVIAVTGSNGKSTTSALIMSWSRPASRHSWRAISGAGFWISSRPSMAR
jgi:UDP-N-acetylmuramoylalanine--D-glutamate ligase